MSKILVTGATGQLGKATIDFLIAKGINPSQITALYRDESKTDELNAAGVNLAGGDYNDVESLKKAFENVDQLIFVSSSDVANRLPQHQNVIDTAKQAGIKYIIYTGFERKHEDEKSPFWTVTECHIETEKWLKASQIPYTNLRNALYMDLVPFVIDKAVETGMLYFPAGEGKAAFVSRAEMGEVIAQVALDFAQSGVDGKWVNKDLSIANETAWGFDEVADMLTEIAGKKVAYVSPSLQEYQTALLSYGVPQQQIDILAAMAGAQAMDDFSNVSTNIETILGRKPLQLKDFLASVYGKAAQ